MSNVPESHESVSQSFASHQRASERSFVDDVRKLAYFCRYFGALLIKFFFSLLFSRHNTHHYLKYFQEIRQSLKDGTFQELKNRIHTKFENNNIEK